MEEPTFSRFSKQNTKSFYKSGYCYDMIIILYKKSSATFTNFSNEKIIDHISLREKFWMMAREIRLDFCYLLLVLASFKNISKSVFIFKKKTFWFLYNITPTHTKEYIFAQNLHIYICQNNFLKPIK